MLLPFPGLPVPRVTLARQELRDQPECRGQPEAKAQQEAKVPRAIKAQLEYRVQLGQQVIKDRLEILVQRERKVPQGAKA